MNIQSMFDLTGKTAIVTGGGRGLGAQIALVLAEAGAHVVVCSRRLEVCQKISEKLKGQRIRSLAMKCDVTNPEDVNHVVEATLREFGHIDILVNNSGATWGAPALEMPLDKWQKVMDVNVKGTFLFSQAVGKVMVKQERGKIINMASVAGLKGSPAEVMDTIGYNASKGAIISFTRDLGVKLAPYNIQVNAIAPGFFPTKMSKGLLEIAGNRILAGTPAGRFGNDEDIRGVALFLASRASDYIIGQTIVVDGGQSSC
ncbi:gluconate 5-dehydrogenase [Kroppenstedtia guangzhouensis]|uniref:Gluconate 5-dehydrogenase n=1 Tax=Kroppenstedtia guangzhouensis TaxID=1274356 RepID=A0ABQ1H477_9BACL|nr:SDR family oxidoreductase [Kroppenstedtia guangzhouensis]GGA58260.1 gluconate 5-dehydrogenase [Kroppenstedtia guangzhouensis]